jgi:glycerophosphoryl diester phosphodiesterase
MYTSEKGALTRAAPLVIAHRGASGYVPEHTLASYFIAIQHGAEYIEPDLVITKDGVLIARHENEIGGTTDVAERPEFSDRKCIKTIDGESISGWFSEDFTLAEIKTLRARERIPQLRQANVRFDGQFEIPTFDEILALVHAANEESARRRRHSVMPSGSLGIYPETKHPSYFRGIGLPLEERLLESLARWDYRGRAARVFVQSFEISNLRQLRTMSELPLIQLIDAVPPYDFIASSDARTHLDLLAPAGLAEIASYATGIGVNKNFIIPRNDANQLTSPTAVVRDAHAQGLLVHAWTFRAENAFLPREFQLSDQPQAFGNLAGEIRAYLDAGVDGLFADHPNIAVAARDG